MAVKTGGDGFMELLFVGTGAADYEMVFTCPCPTCAHARRHGGRNLRTYASLLVDRAVLVDCGPTVPWRLAELHADPADVLYLLITHAHEDHLDPGALGSLARARRGGERLVVLGNEETVRRVADARVNAELTAVRPGEVVQVGRFQALALPATHDAGHQVALNWVLRTGGCGLLYAADTGYPSEVWWELVSGQQLSAAVIEATYGPVSASDEPDCLTQHLNWEGFGRVVSELMARGCLGPGAPALATHVSQHFTPPHDEAAAIVESLGGVLAYDGLRVKLPGR